MCSFLRRSSSFPAPSELTPRSSRQWEGWGGKACLVLRPLCYLFQIQDPILTAWQLKSPRDPCCGCGLRKYRMTRSLSGGETSKMIVGLMDWNCIKLVSPRSAATHFLLSLCYNMFICNILFYWILDYDPWQWQIPIFGRKGLSVGDAAGCPEFSPLLQCSGAPGWLFGNHCAGDLYF